MNYLKLTLTLFILYFCLVSQKNITPTSKGISDYIENNADIIIAEYEAKIDTIYDVYIYVDDEDEFTEKELGSFYLPDQICISNQEKYIAYEFDDLSKIKQRYSSIADRTVKSVVFHELTHAYFNQTIILMKYNQKNVSSEYGYLKIFPRSDLKYGVEFIEEGVCQYVVQYLKESPPIKDMFIPKTQEELVDPDIEVVVKYYYSIIFLQDFLDKYGIKKGIEILVSNKPPTYEEILKPELFFNRLKYN